MKFYYKGEPERFVIPNGVKEVKIEVWGAMGGGTKGGKGGYAIVSSYKVASGMSLYVYVGGQGNGYVGGWNGGGNGGNINGFGYGGGGATDVRTENGNWDSPSGFDSRIVVAGGGGGASEQEVNGGGCGGGSVGGNGAGSYPGYGGTQSSGGKTDEIAGATSGEGSKGIGGSGGYDGRNCEGAGGGGGYYGGGGGDWAMQACSRAGGGGGGSSYGDFTTSCANEGNGKAIISW
jgi:hypothetical protein